MPKTPTGIDNLLHLDFLSNEREGFLSAVSWLGKSNLVILGEAAENINFVLFSSATDMLIRHKQPNGFRIV